MFILMCVVRIGCYPGNSDLHVDTHISGYYVGNFADFTHVDSIISQTNCAQDRVMLYVLSIHTWFGSFQALVTKVQSSMTWFVISFLHCPVNLHHSVLPRAVNE